MSRRILTIILVILLCGCARTARVKTIAKAVFKPVEIAKIDVEKEAPVTGFKVGEKGTYLVAWKGIPVGTVTSAIKEITKYEGRDVYVIELVARTNEFLSKIYKVEDKYITYLDASTFTSRYYEATRREGNYKKDLVVTYDFEKKIAYHKNLRDGSLKTCSIIEPVQDPLSAVYFCRTIRADLGDTVSFYVNLNEKNYRVYGHVERDADINLPDIGAFSAYLIRPYVTLEGEDIKKGRAWGYISSDKNRYPLYGVLKIPWLGEFTASLQKAEYANQ